MLLFSNWQQLIGAAVTANTDETPFPHYSPRAVTERQWCPGTACRCQQEQLASAWRVAATALRAFGFRISENCADVAAVHGDSMYAPTSPLCIIITITIITIISPYHITVTIHQLKHHQQKYSTGSATTISGHITHITNNITPHHHITYITPYNHITTYHTI